MHPCPACAHVPVPCVCSGGAAVGGQFQRGPNAQAAGGGGYGATPAQGGYNAGARHTQALMQQGFAQGQGQYSQNQGQYNQAGPVGYGQPVGQTSPRTAGPLGYAGALVQSPAPVGQFAYGGQPAAGWMQQGGMGGAAPGNYGAQQGGPGQQYGAPVAAAGPLYGAPAPSPGQYGAPPARQQYGVAPQYGAALPQQQFGAPGVGPQYGAPPQQQQQYGVPPAQQQQGQFAGGNGWQAPQQQQHAQAPNQGQPHFG